MSEVLVNPSLDAEVEALASSLSGMPNSTAETLRMAPCWSGHPPARDVLQFALEVLGETPTRKADWVRLAYVVLSLVPRSAVAEESLRAANAVFYRFSSLLQPFVDADDLLARIRERSWRVPQGKLADIVEHSKLRALLWKLASWSARDELRAMSRRPRVVFDEHAIEQAVTEEPDLEKLVDLHGLVARLHDEVPTWAREVVVSTLQKEIEPAVALGLINESRRRSGLPDWTPTALRVFLHRLRAQLRERADAEA